MKLKITSIIVTLLICNSVAAQNANLITETDSIKIYDTYLSLNSKENIFPRLYKDGLIYASINNSNFYKLYYSDLNSKPKKIKTSSNFHVSNVAIFNNEIYFTKSDVVNTNSKKINLSIYKGELNNFKIVKDKKLLPLTNKNYNYAHPSILKNGKQMIIVTNEKGKYHLLLLKRTENNTWVRSDVVFIAQSNFNIINPTFYNDSTIYFSSNSNKNAIVKEVSYKKENDSLMIDQVYFEKKDFDIYKTEKINGIWQLPQKANVFNSEFDDLGVIFTSEKTGYLTTFRFDNTDNIYYFELK